jgi:hypothetical protein
MRTLWICLLLLLSNLLQAQLYEQQFSRPEAVYAPRVYWHWMNGNVTREGINLDLEAMAATKLGGGILFNQQGNAPEGPIRFNSAEWIELTTHALQQADRLGLKFLLHIDLDLLGDDATNISPENASQKIVWTDHLVKGDENISIQLSKPNANHGFYRDIAVLAYPSEKIVLASKIVDLSIFTDAEGKLTWNVPKGNWTIVRIGYTVAGDTAPKPYEGLEVDKLSRNGIHQYDEAFLEPLFAQTRPYHGRSFEGLSIDSCSIGSQNWTQDMMSEFMKRAGYALKPYLLVFTGRQVNSVTETDRFRWDFRRVQSDMLEEYYYEGIRDILKKKALSLLIEKYSLQESTTFTDYPSGMKPKIDLQFMDRLCHVYLDVEHQPHPTAQPGMVMGSYGLPNNRNNTWFSKATDFYEYIRRCQYVLQNGLMVADAAYFLGEETNQPAKLVPGHAIDALSRKDLLQKTSVKNGRLVLSEDIAYRFLVLPDVKTISLPILRKLKVLLEDGLWLSAVKPTAWAGILSLKEQTEWRTIVEDIWSKLPDGAFRYGAGRLFINVSPEVLFEEAKLKPDFSYLSSNPSADIKYFHRRIGFDDAWFVCNNHCLNDTILAGFRITGMQPEWWNPQTGEIQPIRIFRQHDEQTLVPLTLEPYESGFVVFRKALKQPVYDGLMNDGVPLISANPDDYPGAMSMRSKSDTSNSATNKTVLPETLHLNGNRLFRKKGSYSLLIPGVPPEKLTSLLLKKDLPVYDLSRDWIVHFPEGKGAPEHYAMDSLTSLHTVQEFGVKYFSGTASWQRSFNLTPKDLIGNRFVLDLGQVAILAEVYVNEKSVGVCWKPPFRLEVTNLLKPGENQLDIRVTNLWVNRLIGDEFLPVENQYDAWGEIKALPDWYKNNQPKTGERVTFVTWKQYDQNSSLVESGLVGPVTLSVWKVLKE